MPKFCHRLRTLEAIERSPIHQSLSSSPESSGVAMARCRSAILSDPKQAMELLRTLVQPLIDADVAAVMRKYVDAYFRPAVTNARKNLGEENVGERLLEDVCLTAIDRAKEALRVAVKLDFQELCPTTMVSGLVNSVAVKRKASANSNGPLAAVAKRKKKRRKKASNDEESSNSSSQPPPKPCTDVILVSKSGRPVRRDGPKWDPGRLTEETLFILGSRANKALGYGQTRGRLYIKHPELFKYSGDQEDKEWLAKNQLMSTTGGKAYLMVLEDILELAQSADMSSHPRHQPGELVGFHAPASLLGKMRCFMSCVRTDPTASDDDLLRRSKGQIAAWEAERRRLSGLANSAGPAAKSAFMTPQIMARSSVQSHDEQLNGVERIMAEIKTEASETAVATSSTATGPDEAGAGEDDLGFLHGMNINHLVMEFEAATNSNGIVSEAELGGILSLASDDAAAAEEAFPELAEEAVKEEEGAAALPGKCSYPPGKSNDSREGEEAGNSNVASVAPFEGKIEVKEKEGVTNTTGSAGDGATTTTTVTVTVATSNLS